MNDLEQRTAAREFSERWKGKGYEKGQTQQFWTDLLEHVLGVPNAADFITFEDQVQLDHISFMDAYIKSTRVLIEQKSLGMDLRKAIRQSDGSLLTPFQQAKRYAAELPFSKRPRWIITCSFDKFLIHDMESPNGEPEEILLADLEKEYYRLGFITDVEGELYHKEMEVSIKAGEVVGQIYDALFAQYIDPESEETLSSLNVLCVRLVFLLYADDALIFGKKNMFQDYMERFSARDFRKALIELFEVLNTEVKDRDPYMDSELAAFPYVSGGLFEDEHIIIPQFTDQLRQLIIYDAGADFDWTDISPTIFGAVFESTLNPAVRRASGMHYTSVENIHKVIDPLFLDDLYKEFNSICEIPVLKDRNRKLTQFQDKLANLRWLDPASGSGNFLTETYLCIRKLENDIISMLTGGQIMLGVVENPIKVSISQFYGIEINDFAVTVARTALWIAESQMMKETEGIIHMELDFLPLKTYAHIVHGNALRIDWNDVIAAEDLDYIMGNPPFVGARIMSSEQKKDLLHIFGSKWKNAGNLDYVSCWYKKCADFMNDTEIKAALVSTNSITQGEQVPILWQNLFEKEHIHFDFAYRTFIWDSEANIKAHVHCVIIGFSVSVNEKPKFIMTGNRKQIVKNINAYLLESENIFIKSSKNPISKNVPLARSGNKPIDGGAYLFTQEEFEEFIILEPSSSNWFKRWYGAEEFIKNKVRYCLWLGDCSPNELKKMPLCMDRVQKVREFRLSSKSPGTVKIADTPTRFHVETMPTSEYLIMPLTSSERRRYVPIGFMSPDSLPSNLVTVVMDASVYHFGVLTSNVFMAWMRAVGGRLKSDYRITKDNLYNTFPWPDPSDKQKELIEKTAQGILDARALYPDSSLADLYDELTMPPELRKAHQLNDKAVMAAYGITSKDEEYRSESACVAMLMRMYQELTK